MSWSDGRRRSVQKLVTFTPAEMTLLWPKIYKAYGKRAGAWNEFARRAILGKSITLIDVPFDYTALEAQINRIGVNVNQIAHKVNAEDRVTLEEIKTVRREMEETRRLIGEAWKLFRIRQGK